MYCVFCGGQNTRGIGDKKRAYRVCGDCGGIFTLPACFIGVQEQKNRYLLHHNSLENNGYRCFLEKFADPVLARVQSPESILDYGCGPQSVLCELFESYKKAGKLPERTKIRGWDPFFAPDTTFFADGAALVTCLEVAEHFENPVKDFLHLAAAVRSGGFAAVGTETIPTDRDFSSWWYKEDPTHVAFYTEKALIAAAKQANLELSGALTPRLFLFQKSV